MSNTFKQFYTGQSSDIPKEEFVLVNINTGRAVQDSYGDVYTTSADDEADAQRHILFRIQKDDLTFYTELKRNLESYKPVLKSEYIDPFDKPKTVKRKPEPPAKAKKPYQAELFPRERPRF